MKVNRLKRNDKGYPKPLLNIDGPPEELFVSGAPVGSWIDKHKVAIVGSRKATPYGKEVTTSLATQLSRYGVVVISGLALGIDSVAHNASLEAGGTTVAVLPGGLDKIYPASHRQLAKQITDNGGSLISECPPGSQIYKFNFIARNRLISGLADVLIISEAAAGSGSLHTASFALEQGKTVMAVPGNINSPASVGANNLIKSGALPVTSVDDILFALNISPAQNKSSKIIFSGTSEEKAVLEAIKSGVSNQEEIAISLQLEAPQLAFILTYLEINGYIHPNGAGRWQAS